MGFEGQAKGLNGLIVRRLKAKREALKGLIIIKKRLAQWELEYKRFGSLLAYLHVTKIK